MPLCVNVIHRIVLTFESYLVNRQIKIFKKIHLFPTAFLGILCGAGPVVDLAIILCLDQTEHSL
jgi:hypothetical protein